jgi:RimJ/RimL family protein N-acetyltransferase
VYSGKLITLRPFERPDAERYRAWVNDAEIAALIDRVRPVTEAEHATWYEQLDKLWAEVLTTNPRAARAFERAGFVREGLLRADRVAGGRRVDVVRLGLVRGH